MWTTFQISLSISTKATGFIMLTQNQITLSIFSFFSFQYQQKHLREVRRAPRQIVKFSTFSQKIAPLFPDKQTASLPG